MNPAPDSRAPSPAAASPHPPRTEDDEARLWFQTVYQGDRVRQLSLRSIVSGMLIGGVMSVSNLYVGLKTGWGLGVTVTACIIAYAVFRFLQSIVPAYRRDPFTILENYTMSSAASAAGYMSTSGLVSAIPALYLATGRVLAWWEMMTWLAAVSFLGVFMAIPLKRQLINAEKLPFPTGIATAETLRSLHSPGSEAIGKAKVLFWTAAAAAVMKLGVSGLPLIGTWAARFWPRVGGAISALAIPEEFPLFPGRMGRRLLEGYALGFETSLVMAAAGAIMGIRVGVSLLLGAIAFYAVLGPQLAARGIVTEPGYVHLVRWTVWPASAMMVAAGLVAFALRWRTIVRAMAGLAAVLGWKSQRDDPLARIEVPGSWFALGTITSGIACVLLGNFLFDIPWWMGVLAVLMTFFLSVVAARATGETDITPVSAMGKITQLAFGAIAPPSAATPWTAALTTNLMTANITAGAASHSADLLTDLKSGYLLGGNPRKQTISQLFGVLAGTLFCVPVYSLIVHTPELPVAQAGAAEAGSAASQATNLGTEEFPAPSARVWQAVAEMMAKGTGALPPGAIAAMIAGALAGAALTLAEEFAPRRFHPWIPSATAIGIAGVIPAFNCISMFLGAAAAWLWMRRAPQPAAAYTIPASSGLIAGESLMGVAIALWLSLWGSGSVLLEWLW